jgi:hypothetical protein
VLQNTLEIVTARLHSLASLYDYRPNLVASQFVRAKQPRRTIAHNEHLHLAGHFSWNGANLASRCVRRRAEYNFDSKSNLTPARVNRTPHNHRRRDVLDWASEQPSDSRLHRGWLIELVYAQRKLEFSGVASVGHGSRANTPDSLNCRFGAVFGPILVSHRHGTTNGSGAVDSRAFPLQDADAKWKLRHPRRRHSLFADLKTSK